MKINAMRMTAAIMIVSAVIGTNLDAQVRNDVIKAYNEGVKVIQTDAQTAIKAFENTIELSDKVGTDAADLKQKAIKVLPGLYCKVANNALTEKKPANEIIKAAKTAAAVADKYANTASKENANKILIGGYNSLAAEFYAKEDLNNALLAYDSVLLINPDHLNAIHNKTLIYMKQDSADAFEKTADLYIEKLKSGSDTVRTAKAASMALEYFRGAGSKANQDNNLDEALVMLNKAAKYGDDKDLFYYYADVYNKQKNFDNGAEYAQKGLALETGDAEAKAKFYYQLATAQVGKGQTAEACESFKNAMYGPFAEASKAQRTNLKCE